MVAVLLVGHVRLDFWLGGRLRLRLGLCPFALGRLPDRVRAAGVQLAGDVDQGHVDRQGQRGADVLAGVGEPVLAVDHLHVLEQEEVALALDLEGVLVVPAGAAEVGHRAAEVHRRDAGAGRAGGEEAEADREAVEDRVRHVLLAKLAAEPLGLLRRDLERVTGVAGADVAAAGLGQLDHAAILFDESGGARVGDEVAQPAERVLEIRREEFLEAELRDELVRAQPSALVDRA